jgi:4-hydroxybenzoate polyprenyltransferase
VKNGLVVVPLVFSGELLAPGRLARVALAVLAFCCASGAGYALNDLHDLEADRRHPAKRQRPLASGALPRRLAVLGLAALLGVAAAAGGALGGGFSFVLGGYFLGSLAYTHWLKRFAILDVLSIGALFLLRVQGGAVAAGVVASDWLFLVSGLLAVFLGLCKRRHELLLLGEGAAAHRASLREYTPQFLDAAISLTTSTALVTYVLYARAPETVARIGSSALLVGVPFVLYGLLRYLHLVYSKERSPTEALLSDPGVLLAAALFTAVSAFVIYG